MKLFDDMTSDEKIAHIESLHGKMPKTLKTYLTTPIADVWDWYDYWIPWLLKEVKDNAKG